MRRFFLYHPRVDTDKIQKGANLGGEEASILVDATRLRGAKLIFRKHHFGPPVEHIIAIINCGRNTSPIPCRGRPHSQRQVQPLFLRNQVEAIKAD